MSQELSRRTVRNKALLRENSPRDAYHWKKAVGFLVIVFASLFSPP